jgi:hypothetical protein
MTRPRHVESADRILRPRAAPNAPSLLAEVWNRVANDPRVSAKFAAIARAAGAQVGRMREIFR